MHNEEEAAIKAIDSYLQFYSKDNFVLMGNLPESRLKVSNHFKIQSFQSKPYIGPLHTQEKKPIKDWIKGESLELVRIQLQNLFEGFSKLNTKYSLYLHPDHKLRKPLKFRNYADLESNTPNKYEDKLKDKLSKIKTELKNIHGYGHPGLIKIESFFICYEYFKKNQTLFLEIEEISENRTAYDDFILPIIYALCNFTVGDHNITREVRRKKTLWNLNAPLLHQVKH